MAHDREWYLRLSLSREDAVSQWFFLLAVSFLGVTLLAFNRDLGDLVSWRTILLLTSAVGLSVAYSFKVIYTLALGLIGLEGWWGAQAGEWASAHGVKTAGVVAGSILIALLLYMFGHVHDRETRYKRFAMVYFVLGLLSVIGILFYFSTKPGLAALEASTRGAAVFRSWPVAVSLLVFIALVFAVTIYARSQRSVSNVEALAIILLVVLFAVIPLLPSQKLFIQSGGGRSFQVDLTGAGVWWAILFNVLVFVQLLGLIFSGYARREGWLINVGALFLFLLIAVKYFDWFFAFLDKSVFFVGAGILLLAVGWLMEKGRRYVISSIDASSGRGI